MYWNLGVFLVILESPWQVQFNKVYFTIFRAIVWKILIFEWILLLKIQKTYTKFGFGRKNRLSRQCVHIQANGTGYTSSNNVEAQSLQCQISHERGLVHKLKN